MFAKFTQTNLYVSSDEVGVEIPMMIIDDPVFGLQVEFRFKGGLLPVRVSRLESMPFFVKASEQEVEKLKSIGFGKGDGMWGVLA